MARLQDRFVDRLLHALMALALALAGAALFWPASAQAVTARVKEVASVAGVRNNTLQGMGLVVGLDGTGDQNTPYSTQALQNMAQQMGLSLPPGTVATSKNIAFVAVTADLPPFAQPGQAIDVTVSSTGSAKSLRGGTLLATPLRGLDGQIYAIAQGNMLVGGAGAAAGGAKVQINHLSAGRIPNGATVEREVPTPLNLGDTARLNLRSDDFATARAVAKAINAAKGEGTASALDGRGVRVKLPASADERVAFLADLENLPVDLEKRAARVTINPRTGSVVLNESITIGPCAVAHGNLTVTINSTPSVSQPNPLSQGQTVTTEKTDISVQQQGGALIQLKAGVNLADVVKALNSLGATPGDLQAILQAMKSAGALNAEIEVL